MFPPTNVGPQCSNCVCKPSITKSAVWPIYPFLKLPPLMKWCMAVAVLLPWPIFHDPYSAWHTRKTTLAGSNNLASYNWRMQNVWATAVMHTKKLESQIQVKNTCKETSSHCAHNALCWTNRGDVALWFLEMLSGTTMKLQMSGPDENILSKI